MSDVSILHGAYNKLNYTHIQLHPPFTSMKQLTNIRCSSQLYIPWDRSTSALCILINEDFKLLML